MRKILVIDDEPEAIDVLELLLSNLNYEITGVNNPLEALFTLVQLSPDLVILDWEMPQKEGLDLLKEIKAIPSLIEIPVIISTGKRTQPNDLKNALKYGASDFIRKPVEPIELEARVASAINTYYYIKGTREAQEKKYTKELAVEHEKEKQLKTELSKKDREMIAASVSVFQSERLLSKIKSDILNEKIDYKLENKIHLSQVFNKYDNIANSFNWELFRKRFAELNSDFYSQLRADFSSLTPGELRICAFFKVGMSKKEIATLSYSNYEAVRKAIYRIRKKLQLDEEIELGAFLEKY
jgi:DNA-binding response OmpR family regulator